MQHLRPKDDQVGEFIGRKIKINRADEEFIGTVAGWREVDGERQWVLEAANLSKTFLPSQGWEVYDCEADDPPGVAR